MTGADATHPAAVDAVAHVFVESLADRCEVEGDEGHHLQRVRRLTPGETVTAADGSGAWRVYAVAHADAGRLELDARSPVRVEPEPRVPVSLAVALAKGGLDDIVAMVTELGVVRVTPVRTERSVVRWDTARAQRARARLQLVARQASAQSRRARIPTIDLAIDLDALRARPGLVVADRAGAPASALGPPPPAGWTVLVGPEGGLSGAELAALDGASRLCLGPHVVRSVTAPVAAVAILTAAAGRVSPV